MKSLPANLTIEKNRLHSPDPWIVLLEITLTDNTVLRFARNTEDVLMGSSIPDNCIAYWKMNDDADSNVVVDTIGDHDGTYHGTGGEDDYTSAHTVAGKIDTALSLDGVQDYIDTGLKASEIHSSNKLTICFWIKIKTIAADDMLFCSDGSAPDRFYLITRNGGTDLEIGLSDWVETLTANLVVDTWYFIVVILDGTTGYVYKDNVLIGSQAGITVDMDDVSTIKLGADAGGSIQHLHCEFDATMIFNRALTEAERTILWNEGTGTDCPVKTYTAFPFEIEPTKQTSKGEIPTLTVRVSNITRLIQPYLEALSGGIGSTVKIIVVNSAHLSEDYTELEMTFDVLACHTSVEWVTFTLGAPNPLRQRLPLYRYLALHCRWTYKLEECGYVGKTISGITKANPGVVTATAHGFATGDYIYHDEVVGMEEVNGQIYQITKLTADTYSIVDTSGFTPYTSGGVAGYSVCSRSLEDCRDRENTTRYGGFVGMKSGGIRIV